jgi:hypothetical protein
MANAYTSGLVSGAAPGPATDTIEMMVHEFQAAGNDGGRRGQAKTANTQLDSVKHSTREHMERSFVSKALKNYHVSLANPFSSTLLILQSRVALLIYLSFPTY